MNKYKVVLTLTIIIALTGIVLPGITIISQSERDKNKVISVPSEYYLAANSALAKNLSLKLSEEEKIKLCTGEWESNITRCEPSEMNEIAFNSIAKAKSYCTEEGIYNFAGWYSYEAEAYKAVEATFNNYVVYFWKVTLTKHDNSMKVVMTITEAGSVIEAKQVLANGTIKVLK